MTHLIYKEFKQRAFPYVLRFVYTIVCFSGVQSEVCTSGYRYDLSKYILIGLYWLSMLSYVASICRLLKIFHSSVMYIWIYQIVYFNIWKITGYSAFNKYWQRANNRQGQLLGVENTGLTKDIQTLPSDILPKVNGLWKWLSNVTTTSPSKALNNVFNVHM